MPSIGIADKPTLDQIKALIGAINPVAGGTDSLFKYLKSLSDYVDSLETNLGVIIAKAPWEKTPTFLHGAINGTTVVSGSTQTVFTISGPRLILGGFVIPNAAGRSGDTSRLSLNGSVIVDAPYDGTNSANEYDTGPEMYNSNYPWRHPFSADFIYNTSSAKYRLIDPVIVLPMMYVQSSLTLRYYAGGGNQAIYTRYSIAHCAI